MRDLPSAVLTDINAEDWVIPLLSPYKVSMGSLLSLYTDAQPMWFCIPPPVLYFLHYCTLQVVWSALPENLNALPLFLSHLSSTSSFPAAIADTERRLEERRESQHNQEHVGLCCQMQQDNQLCKRFMQTLQKQNGRTLCMNNICKVA